MWNKRTEDYSAPPRPQTVPESAAAGTHLAPAVRAEPAPAKPTKQIAVIGPSMHIKGEIRTREELAVDGEVEGLLESQSLLTVGTTGKVKANIKAREVIVFGSVRGNIEVTEKIAIRDNGSVIGDIRTSGISIDDGAYFKGNIDISRPEPKGAKLLKAEDPPVIAAAG